MEPTNRITRLSRQPEERPSSRISRTAPDSRTAGDTIYAAAGSPPVEGDTAGTCRACGRDSIGLAFASWIKDTFVDHDKLRPGSIICRSCLFCFDDHNEILTARTGKPKLQRMRNYSHFVTASGEWLPLSKGKKARMRELLTGEQSPAVAIIATSGQKHLIFRARMSWWQIEERTVLPFPEQLGALLEPIETLYRAGASKGEIETGHYSQKTIGKVGRSLWLDLELKLRPFRGGLPMQFAVFLGQKDDTGADCESDPLAAVAGDSA